MQHVVERAARLRSELCFEREKCVKETATLQHELRMCRTQLRLKEGAESPTGAASAETGPC